MRTEKMKDALLDMFAGTLTPDFLPDNRILRTHDDHDGEYEGSIRLDFSENDCTFSTSCKSIGSLRFRNFFGGGQSLNTHIGLRILSSAYVHRFNQMTFDFSSNQRSSKDLGDYLYDLDNLEFVMSQIVEEESLILDDGEFSISLGPDSDVWVSILSTEHTINIDREKLPIVYNAAVILAYGMYLDYRALQMKTDLFEVS